MTELSTHSKVSIANVSRRGLLKGVAATGGFVLAAQFPTVKGALASYPTGAEGMPNGVVNNPKVFISIGGDGTVSIVAARAEMGNGAARTALPMMVADELDADWARVRVVQSPGDERTYGNQDTDGSRSVRHWIQPMRHCGAAARLMLEQAAAATWKVDIGEVQAQLHEVVHKPTNRKLGYGELAAAAAGLPVPSADMVKLKDASAFRYIGKGNVRIADIVDITTGKAIYGQDVMVPGMKYAVIARPPVVGGKVASVDSSAAMKVPGVEKIVTLPGTPAPYKFGQLGGVAVIAKNTWAAIKGREALKITWDNGPNGTHDSKAYRAQLEAAVKKPGKVERNVGDADKALASAAKVITAEYYAPHLHHATMEPPAAVARMSHGKWEIWAPVQSPGQARDDIAAAIGVAPAEMTVQPTLLGGGFGRKSKCDFAIEAALLSKDLGGTPVKVVWTREDDIRGGYYRPMWAHHVRVGLGKNGRPMAWRHTIVGQSIIKGSPFDDGKNPVDETSVEGTHNSPYVKGTPHHRVDLHSPRSPVPVLWWRSVGHTHTAFVMETFVDELARLAGKDPVAYRRQLLRAAPRHLRVLELAATKSGWGKPLPRGRFRGIAVHESFGSYVAQVAEVSVVKGSIRVHRVVCAVDCGVCVNPAGVRAQVESAIVFGLTAALHGELTIKNGRVQQSNFHDYPMLRIGQMPEVDVHIVKSREKSGGVGEPGTPPVAPAVANALFAATGKRFRQLPFRLEAS
jgi:isoquinoline 1-oxidoreductase beta subunit